MDAAAAVAVGLVALGAVLGAAVWRYRRGGLRLEVRVWWDDLDDRGPGEDGSADQ